MNMISHLLEWSNLLVRWFHFIAGVAWIGNSFYFVWLDNALTPPEPAKKGVEGDLWMVHSGGFYQVEKRKIAPGEMPKILHWFKWEATFTWLTGFVLLILVYHLHPEAYLVDPASPLSPGQASALGLSLPFITWFIYDALWQSCESPPSPEKGMIGTALSFAILGGLIFGLCHLFGGRAAYIHVAAVIGTIMVLNVWVRILPAQQKMIDATKEGRTPDFELGKKAKRRSMHNSYVTLPVLIIMISNHYPGTYGSHLNAWVLICFFIAGASVRHIMIKGAVPWAIAAASLGFIAAGVLTWQPLTAQATGSLPVTGERVPFSKVQAIISSRCVVCHAVKPADPTFGPMPAGVSFEAPERIHALAERILFRAVTTQTMPLANKTGITPEERAILGLWVHQGASLHD